MTVNKEVTIVGTSTSCKPTILFSGEFGTRVTADNVTFDNLIFRGPSVTDASMLVVLAEGAFGDAPDCSITPDPTGQGEACWKNLIIRNSTLDGGKRAVYAHSTGDITIENNEFTNQPSHTIKINEFHGALTIDGNTISGVAGSRKGILIEGEDSNDEHSGTVTITNNAHIGKTNFVVYNAWDNPLDPA